MIDHDTRCHCVTHNAQLEIGNGNVSGKFEDYDIEKLQISTCAARFVRALATTDGDNHRCMSTSIKSANPSSQTSTGETWNLEN